MACDERGGAAGLGDTVRSQTYGCHDGTTCRCGASRDTAIRVVGRVWVPDTFNFDRINCRRCQQHVWRTKRKRLAHDDPALCVTDAPIIASALPKGAEVQHIMWGCFATNLICRATLPRSMAAALDIIVHNLHSWVDALGAAVAKKAESLVCYRGVHPATGQR